MRHGAAIVLASLAAVLLAGCDWMPGKPTEAERPVLPDQVVSFDVLYGQHCAGCHGADGRFGAALALNDPLYLALVSDDRLTQIIGQGVPGTAMPAFAKSSIDRTAGKRCLFRNLIMRLRLARLPVRSDHKRASTLSRSFADQYRFVGAGLREA